MSGSGPARENTNMTTAAAQSTPYGGQTVSASANLLANPALGSSVVQNHHPIHNHNNNSTAMANNGATGTMNRTSRLRDSGAYHMMNMT